MAAALLTFASAAAAGILMSAPVGPVALISIRRALSGAPAAAFATGTGVVLCDLLVAAAAIGGARSIDFLPAVRASFLLIASGLVVLAAGAGGLRRNANTPEAHRGGAGRSRHAAKLGAMSLQGFVISLGNPLNAAGVATVAAGVLRLEPTADIWPVITAFGLGCLAWWLGLAVAVYRLRDRIGSLMVSRLNRVVSLVLVAVGTAVCVVGIAEFL